MTILTVESPTELYEHLRAETMHTSKTVQSVVQQLVSEHLAQSHRLRGYDAIQLATALDVNATLMSFDVPGLTFITADNDLLAAVQAEGLLVDNPNLHS